MKVLAAVMVTLAVVAVAVCALALVAVSGGGSHADRIERLEPLSDAQVVSRARTACRKVLDAKTCRPFPIRVDELDGENAGRAVYEVTTLETATTRSSRVRATEMILDRELRATSDEYIAHVATHEWNHVRQYRLHPTQEKLDALHSDALRYFQKRTTTTLTGTDGVELLTDCTTVLGHHVPPGPRRGPVTAYVAELIPDASDMETACGTGWRTLASPRR